MQPFLLTLLHSNISQFILGFLLPQAHFVLRLSSVWESNQHDEDHSKHHLYLCPRCNPQQCQPSTCSTPYSLPSSADHYTQANLKYHSANNTDLTLTNADIQLFNAVPDANIISIKHGKDSFTGDRDTFSGDGSVCVCCNREKLKNSCFRMAFGPFWRNYNCALQMRHCGLVFSEGQWSTSTCKCQGMMDCHKKVMWDRRRQKWCGKDSAEWDYCPEVDGVPDCQFPPVTNTTVPDWYGNPPS